MNETERKILSNIICSIEATRQVGCQSKIINEGEQGIERKGKRLRNYHAPLAPTQEPVLFRPSLLLSHEGSYYSHEGSIILYNRCRIFKRKNRKNKVDKWRSGSVSPFCIDLSGYNNACTSCNSSVTILVYLNLQTNSYESCEIKKYWPF